MIEIYEESPSSLASYATVPSTILVREILEVVDVGDGIGGLQLVRRSLAAPYVKDYDAPAAQHPSRWGDRFSISGWGLLTGRLEGGDIARAAVAWSAREIRMLEGREDLAVLWDLRVAPQVQRRGIGTAMFRAAEDWAKSRGATLLKVETQNVNVPACLFYSRQGCKLGAIHRYAYPALPHEAQLLWYKRLARE